MSPQRVRRGDGSWVPVSTRLAARGDGSIAAVASTADISFSGGGRGPLVTWRHGVDTFTLSWPAVLPEPRLEGDSAVYDEVLAGVALHVTATADGFRHALEVKSAAAAADPALNAIRYSVGGTAARRGVEGGLEVLDAAGQVFASAGGAMMWDSRTVAGAAAAKTRAATPGDINGDLVSTSARPGAAAVTRTAGVDLNADELVVTPDRAMLGDPATVYPVFIDPPMNGKRERWAWANNRNFNTDVENRARVGRNPYDGVLYRSFFSFDISGIHDTEILDAEIQMTLDHSWSCTASWVSLYRTGSLTVQSGQRMNWATRSLPGVRLDALELNANEDSGCDGVIQPDARAVFDDGRIRTDLQTAVDPGHRWDAYPVGLCACNDDGDYESEQDRWKKFFTDKTYLVVRYDKPPNAPAPQPFNRTTDCYLACTGAVTVRTSTPTLTVRASDPFAGTLKTVFEVRDAPSESGRVIARTAVPYSGSSGSNASWKVSTSLAESDPDATEGRSVIRHWRARSTDENSLPGDWSAWQTLTIDTTRPVMPIVSSAEYPFKQWGSAVGRPGTFVFARAVGAAEYTWAVDGGSTTTSAAASAVYTPATDMVHVMRIHATDVAGNRSGQVDYQFWVTPRANRCWNWRLDETSGVVASDKGNTDSSDPVCAPLGNTVRAQPGAVSGAVTWGKGYVDNAATFSGAGQIATAGPVLDTSKSFTVMAWVRPSSLASTEQIAVSQDGNTTSRFALMYRKQVNGGAGGWCFGLRDADGPGAGPAVACATGIGAAGLPRAGTWVHLGGVYNAQSRVLQVHVMGNPQSCNGEMVAAASTGTPWAATGSFVIGRGKADAVPAGHWKGSVDQVYAHQRVLTAAEICQQAVQ